MNSGRLATAALTVGLIAGLCAAMPAHARGGKTEAAIRAQYPRVLATWAQGKEAEALEQLETMESVLVRDKRAQRDVEELWRAKLGVIRDTISRTSVEVLVPVMLLHHDAYRHYVGRKGFLAQHSQVMSAELADFYAENTRNPAGKKIASDLLTSLAGHLQSGMVMRRSAELFQRALTIDPENFAAHMGLGSMYERRAELAQAQQHFKIATRLNRDSGEALLRYAMVVARQGDAIVAERQLDRALALDGPAWVLRLAYQQKAMLQESAGEGTEIARQGQARLEESSRDAIYEAFLLERQRKPRQAQARIDTMLADAEPESERYQYARWPKGGLEKGRLRLRDAARAQQGTLISASGQPGVAAPGQ